LSAFSRYQNKGIAEEVNLHRRVHHPRRRQTSSSTSKMAKHWDDWRDTIINYYINDNLTLRDVMQIMHDRHGFIAR
jgi:hypothetical protein